ncbi:hypothetical protein [Dactylosporangium sp. NPDC051484]|uniref:hypothetical protein n=1 Tax=Dactylosporangium sp. NPDC051484 TaxID=3154942 RepID=UPI00344C0338
MTTPTRRQPAPGIVIALDVIAGLWAFAAVLVGNALWQVDTVDQGAHVTLQADNSGAAIAIILCLFAATVAFGVGAIVAQVAKRHDTDAS